MFNPFLIKNAEPQLFNVNFYWDLTNSKNVGVGAVFAAASTDSPNPLRVLANVGTTELCTQMGMKILRTSAEVLRMVGLCVYVSLQSKKGHLEHQFCLKSVLVQSPQPRLLARGCGDAPHVLVKKLSKWATDQFPWKCKCVSLFGETLDSL